MMGSCTYAGKGYVWFSLHHHPTSQSFLHPSNFQEIASLHRDQFAHGGKTINASFEEFEGKETFFVSERFGKKA